MQIVVLDGYTLNPGDLSWDGLEALGELTVYDRTPPAETAARIGEAEIIFTNKTPITRETLNACPGVRYIGVLATGYNVVDVKAAAEKGIAVTNIPTYGTAAVAQYTMALLLEICHHVGDHSESVKRGDWTKSADFCYWNTPLVELAGKTMGFVGFGKIGRAAAKIAAAFGLKILACDVVQTPVEGLSVEYVELSALLSRSDIVSLHCPLFPETEKLINEKTIAQMKDGAILLNTSRGPLIDEEAAAKALKSGKLRGLAADVVSTEPIRADNPLLTAPNCLITPHIAWAPRESRQRLMDIAADNLAAFLKGAPVNIVHQK